MFRIWLIVLLLMYPRFVDAICMGFSQDFQIQFPQGQFKKNDEKNY